MNFLLSLALLTNLRLDGWGTNIGVDTPVIIFVAAKETPVILSDGEIQQRMGTLPPEWKTDGQTLFYERTLEDFVAAIAFVNALVTPAEQLGHHPDITINYNRVSLALTTHDAGGLTALDFQLAESISQL